MTVYAKKNTKGQLSGSYLVEVDVGGKRIRETHKSEAAARLREAELKAGHLAKPPALPPVTAGYTVGDLQREALVIWRGTKDEDQSVQRFESVCDILGTNCYLVSVRTSQLDKVVDTLRARSLGNKTIHRYLAAFSGALRWAVTRDKLVGMPIIPWPECGKGNDTVISREDEEKVFKRLQKVGSPDVALVVETLLATGARISEVLKLEPEDISVDREEVTFRDTKNGDERTVPLARPLGARLLALATVGFPTYRRVNTSLHGARKALGIKHKVTAHVMRHTVGTRLSDAGVAVPTIGKLLGHRSVRTTMGYIHPERAALKAASEMLRRKS